MIYSDVRRAVLYSSLWVKPIKQQASTAKSLFSSLSCSIIWMLMIALMSRKQAFGFYDITVPSLLSEMDVSDTRLKQFFAQMIRKSCPSMCRCGGWSVVKCLHQARPWIYAFEDVIKTFNPTAQKASYHHVREHHFRFISSIHQQCEYGFFSIASSDTSEEISRYLETTLKARFSVDTRFV